MQLKFGVVCLPNKKERILKFMEQIKLKIPAKAWLVAFLFCLAVTTGTIFFYTDSQDFMLVLLVAFSGSIIIMGAIIGIFYFSQKEVVLTNNEIKKVGFSSKSIAYDDIQRIKVGTGGFSIYGRGKNSITITSMYSNFNEAKVLFNQKISGRENIEVNGLKFFIRKFLPALQPSEK
jgi:hypothetical protein